LLKIFKTLRLEDLNERQREGERGGEKVRERKRGRERERERERERVKERGGKEKERRERERERENIFYIQRTYAYSTIIICYILYIIISIIYVRLYS